MPMPRLIFVNRFFFPDHSATSQMLSDLAFHLAGEGRDVHVVTSTQIYDDAKAALPVSEIINGVHVHRVPSTGFGRNKLIGRSIDYVSFYRSMWRCLVALARPGDIIVAKTDPPLTSVVAMAAARRNGARLVNWLQDIYPEAAVALDVPFMRRPRRREPCRAAQSLLAPGRGYGRCRQSDGAKGRILGRLILARSCHHQLVS
jgi:colanic acid biosynthesis glycosyl transferase WcaI